MDSEDRQELAAYIGRLDEVGSIAQIFSHHLGLLPGDAESEARLFLLDVMMSADLFDRRADPRAIERINRALGELEAAVADLSEAACGALRVRLELGVKDDQEAMRAHADPWGRALATFFFGLLKLSPRVRRILPAVQREIEASPRAVASLSRVSTFRLVLVDASVRLWGLFTDRPTPRAGIKAGQPIELFLRDIFEALGEKSSPEKAYSAWLRLYRPPPSDRKKAPKGGET